jgi:hypothetical protein
LDIFRPRIGRQRNNFGVPSTFSASASGKWPTFNTTDSCYAGAFGHWINRIICHHYPRAEIQRRAGLELRSEDEALMFPIFQYIYAGFLLLFPLIIVTYFSIVNTDQRHMAWAAVWPKISVTYFILALFAAVGVAYLWDRQGFEFYFEMGPMAREFEVSILLSKERLIWVFAFSIIMLFQAVTFLDDYFMENTEANLRRPLLFAFFSLFAILALLAGRALLSVLFLEGALFLLHLIKTDYDRSEENLDHVSFFKRALFVVLGLVVMVALSAGKVFPDDAIFIAGFVLYLMSFLFHQHGFMSWNRGSWFAYLLFFALFIFWRLYQAEAKAPEFTLVAFIFTALSAVFAVVGAISPRRLRSFYWYCISIASLQFFTLFSSTAFERGGWAMAALLLVFGLLLMNGVLRGLGQAIDQGWQIFGLFAVGLIHLLIIGLVPGIGWIQLQRLEGDGVAYLTAHLVCIFLLSLNLGRLLDPSVYKIKSENGPPFSIFIFRTTLFLALVLLFLQQMIGVEFSGIGVSAWEELIQFANTKRGLLGTAALCVFFGMLIGAIASRNSFFSGFLKNREKSEADKAPRIDPRIGTGNAFLAEKPRHFIEIARQWLQAVGQSWSTRLQEANTAYENRVWQECAGLGRSFSMLVRYMHGGSVQYYLFYGLIALCVSAVLLYVVG